MPSSVSGDSDTNPSSSELIPLKDAAKLSGLSHNHLAHLIRENELWGMKIGRNWVTTEQAVREYLARGNRPGPKSSKTDA